MAVLCVLCKYTKNTGSKASALAKNDDSHFHLHNLKQLLWRAIVQRLSDWIITRLYLQKKKKKRLKVRDHHHHHEPEMEDNTALQKRVSQRKTPECTAEHSGKY